VTSIGTSRPGVIGRHDDLAAGDRFLDALDGGSATLVLEGEPGIGKTTVWSEIRARSLARGHTVLTSQPVQSETELPFAGLIDLLGEHLDLLDELPGPQRRALDIALTRIEPEPSEKVGSLAASAGFHSLLTRMSKKSPVVIAIDDLQSLDVPTFRVVSFAVRRLGSLRAGLLASVRVPSALDPGVRVIDIGVAADRLLLRPLSMANLDRLIDERLGYTLPRYELTRIEALSGGNAIVALEIARASTRDGHEPADFGGAIPDAVAGLVLGRVEQLPEPTRDALLQCAALSRPTAQLVDARQLEPAIAAGLVALDADDRIRFAHPLFARAVYSRATPARRADVHRWFSERVADPDEQTLHAELATSDRDAGLAQRLHEAAERTRRKGAPEFAAELEERAAARTPPDDFDLELSRRLRGAEHHERAGNIVRATALAEEVLSATRDPAVRARAHGLVAQIAFGESFPTAIDRLEDAIRQPGAEPASVAQLEAYLGFALLAMTDFTGALPHARRAERLALAAKDQSALGGARALRTYIELVKDDRLDRDVLRRALELEDPAHETPIQLRPLQFAATIDLLFGRITEAQAALLTLRTTILESGEEHELPYVSNLLGFASLLRGDQAAALTYVDEALRTSIVVGSETLAGFAIGVRCLASSLAGDVETARADAIKANAIFDRVAWGIGRFYVAKAMSFLALSLDQPAEIERDLGPFAGGLGATVGFAAPAFFYGDLIDARLMTGDTNGAEPLINGLVDAGRSVDSPLALVIGLRGKALLESARGRRVAALEAVAEAEEVSATMAIPSEHGRTMLAKGLILRRTRQKLAAVEALAAARATFDQAGMRLWVGKVDGELARVGLGRAGRSELTETERRIAELAATGLTNREIAAQAFMSPRTVEDVLSRVYTKLHIRSRAELGAWMAARRS
jgi:DNA-binding CsgD family transcriptional regulator/tetratricopeptide (TPR) repeat protein